MCLTQINQSGHIFRAECLSFEANFFETQHLHGGVSWCLLEPPNSWGSWITESLMYISLLHVFIREDHTGCQNVAWLWSDRGRHDLRHHCVGTVNSNGPECLEGAMKDEAGWLGSVLTQGYMPCWRGATPPQPHSHMGVWVLHSCIHPFCKQIRKSGFFSVKSPIFKCW